MNAKDWQKLFLEMERELLLIVFVFHKSKFFHILVKHDDENFAWMRGSHEPPIL